MDKSSVRRICIDDFAIRKRYTYGSVIVNIDTHRIIKGRTKGRSDKKASFFICLLIWRAFGFAELNKVASGIWGFNFPDPLKIIMTFTSASLYSGAFRL